ncbi:hypothetical protein NMK54_06470 [Nocardia otitidiscaviarum]|uniref:hypothetical protein n=1 Tax=Nocardia otitidiscaviarum TaxID=1823 RepID=UPI001FD26E60|nr:hypothetical protein [Nocardia otitidiscaviarum]MCP9619807.1 hypothetical protein [Nocardia otitidiscaviarum]
MTVLSSPTCSATATAPCAGDSGRPRSAIRSARPSVLLVVIAVAFSAFGVGCSNRSEATVDVEGAEPAGIGKEVTVPIAAVVTTVLDAGESPRDMLSRSLPTGTTQEVTLRTDHHIVQQINDQAVRDFSPPAVTIPLTALTDEQGCELVLGNVTSSDPVLAKALRPADGSRAGLEMSEYGAITALRLTPNTATSDPARAALEQAFYQAVYQSIAFPRTPVGVGAVWTVRQRVSGSVPLDQVTTATLTDREGDLLTIALDVTQTPKVSEWELPNNAGTLDIVDYLMHGSGVITVDLTKPLPVSGAITVGGNQTYKDPRSSVTLRQTLSTEVQWGE